VYADTYRAQQQRSSPGVRCGLFVYILGRSNVIIDSTHTHTFSLSCGSLMVIVIRLTTRLDSDGDDGAG